MTEEVIGQEIPTVGGEVEEDARIDVPVVGIGGRSLQRWLMELPVRQGGMGLESQAGLRGPAFLGGLELALPHFNGEGGVCPPLGHHIEEGQRRYMIQEGH